MTNFLFSIYDTKMRPDLLTLFTKFYGFTVSRNLLSKVEIRQFGVEETDGLSRGGTSRIKICFLILTLLPRPRKVTIGKPIANGFPMAAVVTRREIAEAYWKSGAQVKNPKIHKI